MTLEESISIKRSLYKGYRFLRSEIFRTLSLHLTQEYQQDFNSRVLPFQNNTNQDEDLPPNLYVFACCKHSYFPNSVDALPEWQP